MRFPRATLAILALLSLATTAHADVDGGLGPPPEGFERDTATETVESFLRTVGEGDYAAASFALDLRGFPRSERRARGAELARTLDEVVDGSGLDLAARLGRAPLLTDRVDLGQLPSDGQGTSLVLAPSGDAQGRQQWVFTRETVAAIPGMQRDLPMSWATRGIPAEWRVPVVLDLRPWQWLGLAISVFLLMGAWLLGRLAGHGVVRLITRRARLRDDTRDGWQRRFSVATGALFAASLASVLVGLLRATGEIGYWLGRGAVVALILAIAWVCAALIDAMADALDAKQLAREGGARGARTRVQIVRRLVRAIGVVVVIGAVLVQFEAVRELGVSLFASAGLASVVLGFAAQKTLGNLLAGIQISITQPLRLGDDVQIDGDTGSVEEITLSYVVVRLGDRRRLIVPTAKLLETSFRNYTRSSAQLVGEVLIACDFETPIAVVRREAERFVRAQPDFDGDTFGVHVVDTSDRAITLRITASAPDAARAFELRAAIREWAIGFLRELEGGRFVPGLRDRPPREVKGGVDGDVSKVPQAAE